MSSRVLLAAFGHLRCLIGNGPPSFDVGWIVDACGMAKEVGLSFQQRRGVGRGGLHGTRCLRNAPLQQHRVVHGPR
jgi:hypothetical protein